MQSFFFSSFSDASEKDSIGSFSEGHVHYMTLMYSMSPAITFLKTKVVTEQSRAAAVRQALWNREGSLQTRVLRL